MVNSNKRQGVSMLQSHAISERFTMNHKSKFWGLTGIATLGVVAACSALLSGPSNSHAATEEPAWHRVDKSKLFLHDLTSGPATLVASMAVAPDGSVTGDLTELHELRYIHGPDGLVAARSREAVASGVQADGEVYFNASAVSVMAYFEVAGGLEEILLLPGDGVAVGTPSKQLLSEQQRGCRCKCTVQPLDPEEDPSEAFQYIPCSQVELDYEPGLPCDCSSLNGDLCWFDQWPNDGAMSNCKSGWIPVKTNPGP